MQCSFVPFNGILFHMKLADYLSANNLSLSEFGRRAGLSASSVLRVRDGLVVPTLQTMSRIEVATNEQVTRMDLIAVSLARKPEETT